MNKEITDLSVRLILALGAWERGEIGAESRYQRILEKLESIGDGESAPATPRLRSVPNCGDMVQSRERDDELSEMAFYARNIRAFREGKIDCLQHRPKLTLVRSD